MPLSSIENFSSPVKKVVLLARKAIQNNGQLLSNVFAFTDDKNDGRFYVFHFWQSSSSATITEIANKAFKSYQLPNDGGPNQLSVIEFSKEQNRGEVISEIKSRNIDCETMYDDVTKLAEDKAKKLIQELKDSYPLIKDEVKQHGRWRLVGAVADRLKMLGIEGDSSNADLGGVGNCEVIKGIYEEYDSLLDIFCTLKLREVRAWIEAEDRSLFAKPETKVRITYLHKNENGKFKVMNFSLIFGRNNLVDTITLHENNGGSDFEGLMECMLHSTWKISGDNEHVLRFSNFSIETDLEFKVFVGRVEYATAAKSVRQSRSRRGNFWEQLVANFEEKMEDDAQVAQVKSQLEVVDDNVEFQENITQLAGLRHGEVDQLEHVKKVTINQRQGRGTLLYLPTGFGKTFIMLMAMEQHHASLNEKKPYLVVVPKKLHNSWGENIELLKEHQEQGSLNGQYLGVDDLSKAYASKLTAKGDFKLFIVTEGVLKNHVKSQFFQDCLEEHRIHLLNVHSALDRKLFVEKKFSDKDIQYFLEGGENSWRQLLQGLRLELDDKRSLGKEVELMGGVDGIVELLKKISERQKDKLRQYQVFKEKFAGIIVDESNEMLTVKTSRTKGSVKGKERAGCPDQDATMDDDDTNLGQESGSKKQIEFSATAVILDIASTMASHAEGAGEKPLIIASSATPWPNNLAEFRLHMQFLLPSILQKVAVYNKSMFRTWRKFEKLVVNDSLEAGMTNAARDGIEGFVHKFSPWISSLFKSSVSFIRPESQSRKDVVYEVAKITNADEPEVGSEILSAFRKFYSTCLGVKRHPVVSEVISPDEQTKYVQELSSKPDNDLNDSLKMLRNHVGSGRLALYVETFSDAIQLSMLLVEWYKASGLDISLGFFYGLDYVRKQEIKKDEDSEANEGDKGVVTHKVHKDYPQITYNTNRDMNLKCFNNIFSFEGFGDFLDKNLSVGFYKFFNGVGFIRLVDKLMYSFADTFKLPTKIAEHLGLDGGQNNTVIIQRDSITKGDAKKHLAKVRDYKKGKARDQVVERSIHWLESIRVDGLKLSKDEWNFLGLKAKDVLSRSVWESSSVCSLLSKLHQLEAQCKVDVVDDFNAVLRDFEHFTKEKFWRNFKNFSAKNLHKTTMASVASKKGNLFNNRKSFFVRSVMSYLYRISISNVLIFGPAGSSGVRIDANKLLVLSGEWTEGKFIQVCGRVARPKGDNAGVKCQIILPFSDSKFEFFILRYYIMKSLINSLITRGEEVRQELGDIVSQLFLCERLDRYYREKDQFNGEHQQQIVLADPQKYVGLSAFEKALRIIPTDLSKELELYREKFEKLLRSKSVSVMDVDQVEQHVDEGFIGEEPEVKASKPILKFQDDALSVSAEDIAKLDAILGQGIDKLIFMMFPTRGDGLDDLSFDEFLSCLDGVAATHPEIAFVVVPGLNKPATENSNFEEFQSLNNYDSDQYTHINGRLFVKPVNFYWYERDRHPQYKVPPIGQMRNLCLTMLSRLWQAMNKNNAVMVDVGLMSMDADVRLTQESFDAAVNGMFVKADCAIGSQGYELSDYENAKRQDELVEANLAWARKVNQVSQNVYSQLTYQKDGRVKYYGYFSEPIIWVTKPVTMKLLAGDNYHEINRDLCAPFGHWDCEGRRFQRYVREIMKDDVTVLSVPREKDDKQRALVVNVRRFAKLSPPEYLLKQTLTKEDLNDLILRMYQFSQHSMRFKTVVYNTSSHLRMKPNNILSFAPYFYVRNFLNLLGLGPYRAFVFASILYQFAKQDRPLGEVWNDCQDNSCFNVNFSEFEKFVTQHFLKASFFPPDRIKFFIELMSLWGLSICEQINKHFRGGYEEEKLIDETWVKMILPDDYPAKARKEVENKELKFDGLRELVPEVECSQAVIDKLVECLEEYLDFSRLPPNSKRNEIMRQFSHILVDIGRVGSDKVYAVTKFQRSAFESGDARESTTQIINLIGSKYGCKKVISLGVVREGDAHSLQYTYQDGNKGLRSEAILSGKFRQEAGPLKNINESVGLIAPSLMIFGATKRKSSHGQPSEVKCIKPSN